MGATKHHTKITDAFKKIQSKEELYDLIFPSGVKEGMTYKEVRDTDPKYVHALYNKNCKAIADGKPEPYPFIAGDLENFEKAALLSKLKASLAHAVLNIERLGELL